MIAQTSNCTPKQIVGGQNELLNKSVQAQNVTESSTSEFFLDALIRDGFLQHACTLPTQERRFKKKKMPSFIPLTGLMWLRWWLIRQRGRFSGCCSLCTKGHAQESSHQGLWNKIRWMHCHSDPGIWVPNRFQSTDISVYISEETITTK